VTVARADLKPASARPAVGQGTTPLPLLSGGEAGRKATKRAGGRFGPAFGKLGPADRALLRRFAESGTPIYVERMKRRQHPVAVCFNGFSYPLCLARSAARRALAPSMESDPRSMEKKGRR